MSSDNEFEDPYNISSDFISNRHDCTSSIIINCSASGNFINSLNIRINVDFFYGNLEQFDIRLLEFSARLTIDLVVDFGPRMSDFDENFGDDFGFSSSSTSERFSNGSSNRLRHLAWPHRPIMSSWRD